MLWHELATKDGCTVDEAQHRYTHHEFLQWAAFDNVRGIRVDRGILDALFAQLCAYVAAPNMKEKDRRQIKMENFIMFKQPEKTGEKTKAKRKRSTTPMSKAAIDTFLGSWLPMQASIGNLKVVPAK